MVDKPGNGSTGPMAGLWASSTSCLCLTAVSVSISNFLICRHNSRLACSPDSSWIELEQSAWGLPPHTTHQSCHRAGSLPCPFISLQRRGTLGSLCLCSSNLLRRYWRRQNHHVLLHKVVYRHFLFSFCTNTHTHKLFFFKISKY